MNVTVDDFVDDTIQFWGAPNRWAHNSLLITYTNLALPYFYAALALGGVVLLHSAYLHRRKYNTVRIVTDTAALFLILETVLFLPCTFNSSCPQLRVALLNNVFGNCICGGIVQVCSIYISINQFHYNIFPISGL